jgi:hypothetical protein
LEDLRTPSLEGGKSAGLVQLRQEAAADHIGSNSSKNSSKTALDTFSGHLVRPF